MSDIDAVRREIMEQVAKSISLMPVLGEAEFTVRQFAEMHDISMDMARRRLDDLVEAGTMGKDWRRMPVTGQRVQGYWLVESENSGT